MQNNTIEIPKSILTKSQFKTWKKTYTEGKDVYSITATVRYDDQCGNGHNSFGITADIRRNGREYMGGCCHEEVAKHFPGLAPLIKWHLTSSDGPMHYVANTVYHALQHGPDSAWVFHKAFSVTPPGGGKAFSLNEQCLKYCDMEEANAIVASNPAIYYIKIDDKTAKTRNLDHARSCAVWPEATDEDLTAPGLEQRLMDRLPALLAEFKAAVESLGFTF